ncbi:MAG: hypothetical protein KGL39_44030 [Patescibacteria group bacterium]|nr:hypothetical protein [Patescibacteria group bacterium]
MDGSIKFRAWDKVQHEMSDPFDLLEAMSRPKGISVNDIGRAASHLVFMRYTGLHDRNGKEIYEGDIIGRYHEWATKPVEFKEVKWHLSLNHNGWNIGSGKPMSYEVLGNIYESPELLKTVSSPSRPRYS